MRKLIYGASVLLAAGMLAACGGKAEPETTAAASVEIEKETDPQESYGPAAEAGTGAQETGDDITGPGAAGETPGETDADTAEEDGYVTGTVLSIGMSALTIRTEDGEEMSFLKEDPIQDIESDLVEGLAVVVAYHEEGGMQTVDFISDGTIVFGEVVDYAMSTMQLTLEDGSGLQLEKSDAYSILKDGLLVGNSVAVIVREQELEGGETLPYASFLADAE